LLSVRRILSSAATPRQAQNAFIAECFNTRYHRMAGERYFVFALNGILPRNTTAPQVPHERAVSQHERNSLPSALQPQRPKLAAGQFRIQLARQLAHEQGVVTYCV
jgi:hypothetical protein